MWAHYGPLHWWPGDSPFEVMVGAILTQNTSWKNVEKALQNLKSKNLLNPKRMSILREKELAKLIRPAGFFRVKAKRLKNFLNFLMAECEEDIGRLKKQSLAKLREKLLRVNGIGPETADSILLYALKKPIFVIDTYTERILERHLLIKKKVTLRELQHLFMSHLPKNVSLFNAYHAELVNIGKDFCRVKPRCHQCPLNGFNW